MAEVTKSHTGATETTDVKVGDTVIYIDGQNGLHFDAQVIVVSAEGRSVDLTHPDPKQPRRNGVQHSDDGVWHSWHFKPADAPAQPAPVDMVQETPPLPASYTKPAPMQESYDPIATGDIGEVQAPL